MFLMYAFHNAPIYVLASFSYFGIITSFGFAWIFFGEFRVYKLYPGVMLIIASGLTILWRERRQNTERNKINRSALKKQLLTFCCLINNGIHFLSSRNSWRIRESNSSIGSGLVIFVNGRLIFLTYQILYFFDCLYKKKDQPSNDHKNHDCGDEASPRDYKRPSIARLHKCFVYLPGSATK